MKEVNGMFNCSYRCNRIFIWCPY